MLTIKDVLDPPAVKAAMATLKDAAFVDGKASAHGAAQDAKSNVEAVHTDPAIVGLAASIRAAIEARPEMSSYGRPAKWSPIILSKYENGAEYGTHTDAPFMADGAGSELRVDMSFTLFLNDPASYGGGELVMTTLEGVHRFKLPAGSMILYPTTLLHRVTPVTRGARYAAVGWIQSHVADVGQRRMLAEFEQIIADYPDDARRRGLVNIYANLMRMWGA